MARTGSFLPNTTSSSSVADNTTVNGAGQNTGTFATSSATPQDITNCTVTATVVAGSVLVNFSVRAVQVSAAAGFRIKILMDGSSIISGDEINGYTPANFGNVSYTLVQTGVAAGSHTWKAQLVSDGSKTITLYNAVLNIVSLG